MTMHLSLLSPARVLFLVLETVESSRLLLPLPLDI
jgi:hypothetical protein